MHNVYKRPYADVGNDCSSEFAMPPTAVETYAIFSLDDHVQRFRIEVERA